MYIYNKKEGGVFIIRLTNILFTIRLTNILFIGFER